jgi:hypothetical protein
MDAQDATRALPFQEGVLEKRKALVERWRCLT